jgi:hypothetical protein
MREDLYMAYLSCEPRIPDMGWLTFEHLFKDWEYIPLFVKSRCVGSILMFGPVLHVCVIPEGFKKWCTPSIYKEIMVNRFKKFGKLITEVVAGNDEGRQFVERSGFRLVNSYGKIDRYQYGD